MHRSRIEPVWKEAGVDHRKAARPSKKPKAVKVCVACGRAFTWRKKWERCWEQVRYCSDRCRSLRRPG
ncbi:MAG: DUF2256 domain-containing protein [Planctomycetia bacterium]|nr:DUF2256 domain-containing protein [Planctomycetia bacterium]